MKCIMNVFTTIIMIGALYTNTIGQTYFPTCGTMAQDTTDSLVSGGLSKATFNPSMQRGGQTIPTQTNGEEYRVLVIYIRFPDDFETNESWEDYGYIGDNVFGNILSPPGSDPENYPVEPPNLSRYFWDNSYGTMRLVGDTIMVTMNHNELYYHDLGGAWTAWERICREALEEADSTIDFNLYNRWVYNNHYNHTFNPNNPDNRIDHVWFILRNYNWIGNNQFAINMANLYIQGNYVVCDGVRINSGLRDGITIFGPNIYTQTTIKDNNGPTFYGTVVHELAHHMVNLTPAHFGDASNNSYNNTLNSAEGDFFTGYYASSGNAFGSYGGYEKWRANWLSENEILHYSTASDTCVEVDLLDIDSELEGIKLIEIDLGGGQLLILETRGYGRFDSDYVPYNGRHARMPKGVLAYNVVSEAYYVGHVRAHTLTADGHYDWRLVVDGQRRTPTNQYDILSDVIDKGNPNPYNGHSERHRIHIRDDQGNWIMNPALFNTRRSWYTAYHPASNNQPARGPYPFATNFGGYDIDCDDNNGDLYDLHQVGAVISPFSNPPTRRWNATNSEFETALVDNEQFAIYVVSFNDNDKSYLIRICRGDTVSSFTPAPPQNVHFAPALGTTDCPKLRWDLNQEPNIIGDSPYNGMYEIDRAVNDGSWEYVTTVYHPTSVYEDTFSYLDDGISTVRYRIRAIDYMSQTSAWSQVAEIHVAKGTLDTDNTPHIYPYSDLLIPSNVEATLGITFPAFTRITFCPGTVLAATDSLIFNHIETNEHSWFAVSGTLVLNENSRVDQLKKVTTAASGKIFVGDRSLVLMLPDGQITMTDNSVIDALPEHAADFRTYSPSLGNGRLWNGFTFMDQVTGTVSNIVVQDAASALATFGNGVSIHDNWLFRNTVGLTAYAGNSDFYDNRVDSNSYAGLVGYFLTNPIYQNRFNKNWIGAEVFMSSNTYKDNRFDSCTVIGFSSTSMNNLNFNENCDTTNGNSMRRSSDGIGVVVTDQSVANFNCDNSVRLNYVYDFQLEESDVYGTSEFPASPNVDQDMWSIFSWACSIGYEPVLYKSGSSPGFDNAMATARSHHRNRSGFAALIAYRNAFNLASNAREVRKSLLSILHLLRHARNGNGFSNFNADSLSNVFSANLAAYIQDTTKEIWFRTTGKEILATYKTGSNQFTDAEDLFSELAVSSNVPAEKKPRMYHKLVAVRYGGLKNYESAYNAYLALRSVYPNSPEVTYSKVILKLPLTDEDYDRIRNRENNAFVTSQPVYDESMVWSESYPNPFNPTAVIRYSLPTRCYVSLRVYSSLGKLVATLVNDARDKGIHEVRFDADDLPSGVYRYELRVIDEETYRTTTNYGNMLLTK